MNTSAKTARGRDKVRGVARFLGLFGAWVVGGHLLLDLPWLESGFVQPWTTANTRLAAVLAGPLGVEEARADGPTLAGRGGSVEVLKGCDGITALLLVCATVLAFPATWRSRLAGVALGVAGVFLVNAVRLASLLLVAVRWPSRLDFAHVDVWQPLMVFVAFGLFFTWGLLVARPSR